MVTLECNESASTKKSFQSTW